MGNSRKVFCSKNWHKGIHLIFCYGLIFLYTSTRNQLCKLVKVLYLRQILLFVNIFSKFYVKIISGMSYYDFMFNQTVFMLLSNLLIQTSLPFFHKHIAFLTVPVFNDVRMLLIILILCVPYSTLLINNTYLLNIPTVMT